MTLRSMARRAIEKRFNVQIVPPGQVALVFEHEHLRRFFRHFAVDCVFDVGANAGQYAHMLRSRVEYAGPIISYEPIPGLADELRKAARADAAWFIEESALGERESEVSFNIYESDQFSSLHDFSATGLERFPDDSRLRKRITVQMGTMAAQLEKYRGRLRFHRAFLKMDTQGHDIAVAKGAGERLREFVGLQSELSLTALYQDSPTYAQALEYYKSQGFELSALVPNNLGHFPRLLEIDCIMYRAGSTR